MPEALGPALVLPAGAKLMGQFDPPQQLYYIEAGLVRLERERRGRGVLVAIRGPGWLLGAAAAVAARPAGTTALALTPCRLRPLRTASFMALRTSNNAVGMWLQLMLANEVLEHLRRAALLAGSPCQRRVEEWLVELFAVAGAERTDGALRLTVDVSVTTLADLATATREHVSRVLSVLRDQQVVVRVGGWLVIPRSSPLKARVLALRKSSGLQLATESDRVTGCHVAV